MIDPPHWSSETLESERNEAIAIFRQERMREPLEAYLESFDSYQSVVEDLLETTVDLAEIEDNALNILTDPRLLDAFRYLAGPPISEDDLKVLSEASSLNRIRLEKNPDLIQRIVSVVMTGLDRRRFAWVAERREPTEAEKSAAVIASAALLATQRLGTDRRSGGKKAQEESVENSLIGATFSKVSTRKIDTFNNAPKAGEFCGESLLGNRKADFIVRLWDHRVMPIECKVSNSSTNSVKRLNNDAAAKAVGWKKDFGERQIVPVAVLSGVYKLHNLVDAQNRGLTIFWAHDLNKMIDWISSTKSN